MPSEAIQLHCEPDVLRELERLSRGQTDDARLAERARIILACLSGKRNKDVAAEYGTYPSAVGIWRKRFAAQGLDGLRDKPRSGKPPKYPPVELKQRIMAKLEETLPAGLDTWDGGSLAEELAVSGDVVWRIMRKEGIQHHRHRFWSVSTDPEFTPKSADILGLYLAPPQKALVLCVDKKPPVQVLEQTTGCIQAKRNSKIVPGRKNTYKRHGTINLFAALNVATRTIQPKTTTERKREKKRSDFQSFMGEVVATVPDDRDIHVILDNCCTHSKNERWLTEHPNVHFHLTPSTGSWYNQVELWFEILCRKALSGASFTSSEQLVKAIESFVIRYNEIESPFVWRKR
jgi:transposase